MKQTKKANWFLQHIPHFVDCSRSPQRIPFKTTRELLNLDVVRGYKGTGFSHFAMSDNDLMAISDNGHSWWVVGHVGDPSVVDLPQWDGGRYKARLANGKVVELTGDEVIESCGDELTLQDGSKAQDLNYDI
jgi:hypothetical protein